MERASSLVGVSAIAVITGLRICVENSPAVMAAVVVVVGAEEKAMATFEYVVLEGRQHSSKGGRQP